MRFRWKNIFSQLTWKIEIELASSKYIFTMFSPHEMCSWTQKKTNEFGLFKRPKLCTRFTFERSVLQMWHFMSNWHDIIHVNYMFTQDRCPSPVDTAVFSLRGGTGIIWPLYPQSTHHSPNCQICGQRLRRRELLRQKGWKQQ